MFYVGTSGPQYCTVHNMLVSPTNRFWCRIGDNSCVPCEECSVNEEENVRGGLQHAAHCTAPAECLQGAGPISEWPLELQC